MDGSGGYRGLSNGDGGICSGLEYDEGWMGFGGEVLCVRPI